MAWYDNFWGQGGGAQRINSITDLSGGGAQRLAAYQQEQAQREAAARNSALVADERERAQGTLASQLVAVNNAGQFGRDALSNAYGQQQGYYNQGASALANQYAAQQGYYNQAGTALGQGRSDSLSALQSGYNQARSDMAPVAALGAQYAGGATTALQSGRINPYDVTNQRSGLEARMGQGDALLAQAAMGTNLEMDPGYQFRQQQGEQALMRSRAAQGGRLSGAALKELSSFNQGLASQEYAAADQRRLAQNQQLAGIIGQQYGAAGNVDAMRQAALLNQAGRTDSAAQQQIQNNLTAGLQAQQNQMGLAQMGYGAQGQLAQMANQYGQNQSAIQSQYGSNMANLYGQQGAAAQQFGGSMANLYGQQAGAAQQYGSSVGNSYLAQGAQQAAAYGGMQDASTGLTAAQMGVNSGLANLGGMQTQAMANSYGNNANQLMTFLGMLKGGGMK